MALFCKWFGHVPNHGWKEDKTGNGYFWLTFYAHDGMDVVHANVIGDCERCGIKYQIGRVHLPKTDRDI